MIALVTEAQAGNLVVRLKGGDPFIFGRGGEEVEACDAAGIAVEVIGKDEHDAETLEAALKKAATKSTGHFWLVLIGHGTFDNREVKFNLRGPDVSAKQLAAWCQPIQRELIFIDGGSCSAGFMQPLAGQRRIIITGTKSVDEIYYTRFGEFFAPAIAGDLAADLDQDKQVSILEAFRHASKMAAEFYEKEERISTEHALIEDNGDGVGDLPGITQRLDYVAKLGADAVWLSPIFKSPMKDFGYDVSDYCDVDPLFGTLDDFRTLVNKAHDLGLKVMIDQVLSHTSDQHPWFAESRASRDNPKADWYVWADAKDDGNPPNNWLSIFGGSAWQWDTRRRQYYLHNFLSSQPDLNYHNPDVVEAILGTVKFWLELGVDGYRLDTANFYFHDKQLRNNPARGEPDGSDHLVPVDIGDPRALGLGDCTAAGREMTSASPSRARKARGAQAARNQC